MNTIMPHYFRNTITGWMPTRLPLGMLERYVSSLYLTRQSGQHPIESNVLLKFFAGHNRLVRYLHSNIQETLILRHMEINGRNGFSGRLGAGTSGNRS